MVGTLALTAAPAAAVYYSDNVTFKDSGCEHYGFSRYDSAQANVKGYTMPMSTGAACQYNGTGAHYAGIVGSFTWGNGVVNYIAGASATGLAHTGGAVRKLTTLPTNPR